MKHGSGVEHFCLSASFDFFPPLLASGETEIMIWLSSQFSSHHTPLPFWTPAFLHYLKLPQKYDAVSQLQAHFIHPSHMELNVAPHIYSVLFWLQALYILFSFWNVLPVLHSNDSYSSIISHLRCHSLQGYLAWPSKARLRATSLYSYKDPILTNIIELIRLHYFTCSFPLEWKFLEDKDFVLFINNAQSLAQSLVQCLHSRTFIKWIYSYAFYPNISVSQKFIADRDLSFICRQHTECLTQQCPS